jgi:hypothetical protein
MRANVPSTRTRVAEAYRELRPLAFSIACSMPKPLLTGGLHVDEPRPASPEKLGHLGPVSDVGALLRRRG